MVRHRDFVFFCLFVCYYIFSIFDITFLFFLKRQKLLLLTNPTHLSCKNATDVHHPLWLFDFLFCFFFLHFCFSHCAAILFNNNCLFLLYYWCLSLHDAKWRKIFNLQLRSDLSSKQRTTQHDWAHWLCCFNSTLFNRRGWKLNWKKKKKKLTKTKLFSQTFFKQLLILFKDSFLVE